MTKKVDKVKVTFKTKLKENMVVKKDDTLPWEEPKAANEDHVISLLDQAADSLRKLEELGIVPEQKKEVVEVKEVKEEKKTHKLFGDIKPLTITEVKDLVPTKPKFEFSSSSSPLVQNNTSQVKFEPRYPTNPKKTETSPSKPATKFPFGTSTSKL